MVASCCCCSSNCAFKLCKSALFLPLSTIWLMASIVGGSPSNADTLSFDLLNLSVLHPAIAPLSKQVAAINDTGNVIHLFILSVYLSFLLSLLTGQNLSHFWATEHAFFAQLDMPKIHHTPITTPHKSGRFGYFTI